jgi:hypothetical protein
MAAVFAAMLALAGGVIAQPASTPADPPPPAAAQALPQPGDTNAERAKTQPGNNAPFWRAVRESGTQPGYVSLPGLEMGQLVQTFVQYPGSEYTTAGEAWRQVRNRWLIPYGGALLLIMLLAAALHYLTKGPIGVKAAPTGRMIERFTPLERAAHWVNAAAFVVLAVSGIVMAFGKFFLLPVIGSTLFGWLTFALKTLHNFVGPLFAVSLVIVIATFIKDNFPGRPRLAGQGRRPVQRGPCSFAPLQRGREGAVLGRRAGARPGHRGFGAGAQPADPADRADARQHAGRAHDPRCGVVADDGAVHRPHLRRNGRREGCVRRDAARLCRRGLGPGAPRVLARRHPGGAHPGAALRERRPAGRIGRRPGLNAMDG